MKINNSNGPLDFVREVINEGLDMASKEGTTMVSFGRFKVIDGISYHISYTIREEGDRS